MKKRRIWFHIVAIALLWLFESVMTAPGAASAQENQGRFRGQWDLIKVSPIDLTAYSGEAVASAQDGSKITMTGSGTFGLTSAHVTGGGTWLIQDADGSSDSDRSDRNVTGGGTWLIQDAAGVITSSGSYRVQSVVRFDLAPGTFPCPPFGDSLGNCEDVRGGLLVLNIDYLDGSEGILVVSCHLLGTPSSVFEGIAASKGFVDFWKHESGATIFHIRR